MPAGPDRDDRAVAGQDLAKPHVAEGQVCGRFDVGQRLGLVDERLRWRRCVDEGLIAQEAVTLFGPLAKGIFLDCPAVPSFGVDVQFGANVGLHQCQAILDGTDGEFVGPSDADEGRRGGRFGDLVVVQSCVAGSADSIGSVR